MSLNIKNEETHRRIRQLAQLTGETLTGAVDQSVRERMERVRRDKRTDRLQRLLKIGKDCAAHLKEPYGSISLDELLYDDKGLPR
jgi:antitoxin VapB